MTGQRGAAGGGWRRWWRGWLSWLPLLAGPMRRGVVIFAVLPVIEYLVVPELVGASKDLYLLGRLNAAWLIAGVALEAMSLLCYGLLTRALLPPTAGRACPGCSASISRRRRWHTSSRPARWAAPESGTGCSPPRI